MATVARREAERTQYLAFRLDGTNYALPILKVREIAQLHGLSPVPDAPRTVRGVLELRGGVVPVIDLRAILGAGATSTTRTTCVLVVDAQLDGRPHRLGLLADAVLEVIDAGPDDIEPPPRAGAATDWLVGITRLERSLCLVLDLDRTLGAESGATSAPTAAA